MASLPASAGTELEGSPRIAIIDIGSNSVRLVVYKGLNRTPAVLFNEKVMAGLGRNLSPGEKLNPEAKQLALTALARFALLCRSMSVDRLRAVATAAIRDAADGQQFVEQIHTETGLSVEVIAGEIEARGAAMGVIAGIPDADGIVGDLGGGSLELVRVSAGIIHERLSLPLGALRLDAFRKDSREQLYRQIEMGLEKLDWADAGRGKPFYAVGGSWRALAHLHMYLTGWPLPVIHQHVLQMDAPDRIIRTLAQIEPKSLKKVSSISSARIPQLPGAAAMLKAVTRRLGSSHIITSAYGLREGLLYQTLPEDVQTQDPLISAAREIAERMGRFPDGSNADVGEALRTFIEPLFPGETASYRRILHAGCLLADTAWRAHPDMRAEDGMDMALHGNWAGIDAAGRAMLAAILWVVNGGSMNSPETTFLRQLADEAALLKASHWGLAMRLAQRLGGGTAGPLAHAGLTRSSAELTLSLRAENRALYGEPVARRHRALAQAMCLVPQLALIEG